MTPAYACLPRLTSIARAAAILAMGTLATTYPVHAQQNASPASDTEGLQTVVVTAQKRAEPLQKVPVAVNMVDSKAIENQQIVDFTDLTRVAPAMTVNQNNGTNSVSLRGIGTYAFSIGLESAVSVIVDDVPAVQQMQAFSNLSDIERIEVLRGPQGTLFGKNSSAGVINVVTRESSDEFGGQVQVTATSDHERKVEASLSGPLSAGVGFRLNAFGTERDGELRNLTTGEDVNGERAKGLRARLDFKPNASLRGKIIADYANRRVTGPTSTMRTVPAGARLLGAVPLAPSLAGITPGPENRDVRLDNIGYTDSTTTSLSGTLNWTLDRHTLTSVTTWQDWKYDYQADLDGTEADLLGTLTRGSAHGGVVMGGPYRSKMLTQELRITSDAAGPLSYLAGLYYSDSTNERDFVRGPAALLAKWSAEGGNRTIAAFGQAEYRFTDATRASAGLRYNREKVDVDFTNQLPATPLNYRGSTTDDAVTGKLALQHDLSQAVMVYGSFATGYKGAGYDISTGFDQSRITRPVAPETSKAYELGVKSRFLQNRVQLNATAFLTDYEDFQAQSAIIDPVTSVLQVTVNNVGALRTRGVELELTARPVKSLLLDASVAYVDAVIKEFPFATCYPGQTAAQGCRAVGTGTAQDLAGQRLSNSPKLKYNLGATYNFGLFDSAWRGVANVNYQHQSAVNFDLNANPLTVQDAYGVLNGSIGFTSPSGAVKLTLFANNLLDQSYATFISDGAGFFGGTHVLTQNLPRNSQRYVGLRLKYEF